MDILNFILQNKVQNNLPSWLFKGAVCEKMLLYLSELKILKDMMKIDLEYTTEPYMEMCITVLDASDEITINKINEMDRSLEKYVSECIMIPPDQTWVAHDVVKSKEYSFAKMLWDESLKAIRIYADKSSSLNALKRIIASKLKIQDSVSSKVQSSTRGSQFQTKQDQSTQIQEPFHYTSQFNKVQVHVYKCDILSVTTDAIVNAANESLQHFGGVASAIAQRAGKSFLDECDSLVANSQLKVTNVVDTSAGNLSYKAVLHAIGPRWKDYKNKKNCVDDVKYTIKNILKKAERMKFASVAIPSISAGTNFKLYNSTWVNLFIKILSVVFHAV